MTGPSLWQFGGCNEQFTLARLTGNENLSEIAQKMAQAFAAEIKICRRHIHKCFLP